MIAVGIGDDKISATGSGDVCASICSCIGLHPVLTIHSQFGPIHCVYEVFYN